jgi:hypothetical protein
LAGKERALVVLGQGRPLKAGVSKAAETGFSGRPVSVTKQAPCKAGSDAPKNGLLHALP